MNKIAKAVRCIESGIEYVSSGAAGKAMGIDPSGILKCCKGLAKTAAGKTWEFVENTANNVADAVKDTVDAVKEAVSEEPVEKKEKLVRDIMITNVVTVPTDAPLMLAEHIMFERNLLRLPVVTDGKLVGIITKYDIQKKLEEIASYTAEQLLNADLSVMKFVKAGTICTTPDEPISEVIRAEEEYNVKFLPVVESTGSNVLVGVVTYFDALNAQEYEDEEDEEDEDL